MARFTLSQARAGNRAAIQRLTSALEGYSPRQLEQAGSRTLAGARRRFEPAAKRVIRGSYSVKPSELSGKFRVLTGADTDGEFIALQADTRATPLIQFGGRWGGRARINGRWAQAASAQIRRGGRKIYLSAFIATINGTRRMVVRQLLRDGGGKRDPRNRLRSLTGPSPYQMLEGDQDANARAVADEVNAFIARELPRQLRLLRKTR